MFANAKLSVKDQESADSAQSGGADSHMRCRRDQIVLNTGQTEATSLAHIQHRMNDIYIEVLPSKAATCKL
jgi:hypothetical protein